MKHDLIAAGRLLTASREDRVLRYKLLPFGEPGNTSRGKLTAAAGTVTIPSEPVQANLEHDVTRPVGKVTATETPDGLEAELHVAATRAGDDLLEEAAAGLRTGISVELDDVVIRSGRLVASVLTGAGVTVRPAFDSARLVASDFGDDTPAGDAGDVPADTAEDAAEELTDAQKALAQAAEAIAAAQAELSGNTNTNTDSDEPKDNTVPPVNASSTAPASPDALLASFAQLLGNTNTGGDTGGKLTAGDTLAGMADHFRATLRKEPELRASELATMTQTDLYDPTAVPAYLGELWRTSDYEEIWAPLISHAPMTAMEYRGWRWTQDSEAPVDDWEPAFTDEDDDAAPAGNNRRARMNPIPTGKMRAESKTFHGKRLAGGRSYDRVNFDWPVPGVMESLLREETEYIKKKRDLRVRNALLNMAADPRVTPDAPDLESTWKRIIFGAMSVRKYGKPTFAVVGNAEYRAMLGTDMLENLALLEASLDLSSGSMAGFRIQPADIEDAEMDGRVLVGVGSAAVLHEPAGAPIRVNMQNLVNGSIDEAVFSYYMLRTDDRGGVVEVPGLGA